MTSYQRIAAYLMLLSGLTHPVQILIYPDDPEVRAPALAGSLFFLVGLGLLTRFRILLVVAIILPLLGGLEAIQRILTASPTPFTYFHTGIDFVVVGLSATALLISFRPGSAAEGDES